MFADPAGLFGTLKKAKVEQPKSTALSALPLILATRRVESLTDMVARLRQHGTLSPLLETGSGYCFPCSSAAGSGVGDRAEIQLV